MSSTQNGKSQISTQAPEMDKVAPIKKRAKTEEKPKKHEDSDEEAHDEEEDNGDGEGASFFNAITKFSALKPGCYYKIVVLKNYRNHRLVAVPVKGFEGTFKNFNNLVQQ